jgi:hypothetical protein
MAYNLRARIGGRLREGDAMSHERIESALELLLEGFEDLQEEIEEDILGRVVEEKDTGPPPSEQQLDQMDDRFFARIQSSVAQVIERGRCEAGDLLAMVSVLAEALEELAPELFEDDEDEDGEDEEKEDE